MGRRKNGKKLGAITMGAAVMSPFSTAAVV